MLLPFAQRADKAVYLPQRLPAGIHLQSLESVIVAQRAFGGRAHQTDEYEVMELLTRLGIAHLALTI